MVGWLVDGSVFLSVVKTVVPMVARWAVCSVASMVV